MIEFRYMKMKFNFNKPPQETALDNQLAKNTEGEKAMFSEINPQDDKDAFIASVAQVGKGVSLSNIEFDKKEKLDQLKGQLSELEKKWTPEKAENPSPISADPSSELYRKNAEKWVPDVQKRDNMSQEEHQNLQSQIKALDNDIKKIEESSGVDANLN